MNGRRHEPPTVVDAFRRYRTAVVIAVLPFALLSLYLFFRRGYYDLFIANKIFAGVAAILFGLVLILGPLRRSFPGLQQGRDLRKEFGIVAFFLALVHSAVSSFFLESHFSRTWFVENFWSVLFGGAALVVFAILLVISYRFLRERLGMNRWRTLQNWGMRIGFLLVVLHVGVMKFPGWISWYQKGGEKELVHPEWPGAGLLIAWVLAFALFIRLADFLGPRATRVAVYLSIIALPALLLFTFWWGGQAVNYT
ncbi:MAG: ferric reductase-like transmembrane domain-containing protein [Candidatus Kerfeldbacteria bacterium]|nr:ferric reductase-like transmembrane domain-containing protein [Candidatus Kerfeldbacteria bacterium]